jgi:hypothetical protein
MWAEPTLISLLLTALLSAAPAQAGTSVAPPPVLAVQSPPRLVAVPGSPVLYGPRESYTLFVYRGRYYSSHRGAWFLAAGPGNAWKVIATDRVPDPVLAVPPAYYRIPPSSSKTH